MQYIIFWLLNFIFFALFDVTSGNFNSQKDHEDDVSE